MPTDPAAVPEALPTIEAWRRERGKYIGGSDVAAILGLSPYRNIGEVWLEKVRAQERLESGDESADPEVLNRFTRWGKRHEGVILDEYADITGFSLTRPGLQLFRHPQHAFIGGTIDAEAVTQAGDERIVEAKTTDSWTQFKTQMWGADGSDEIPEWYLVQGMQYMIVRGRSMCDFPVLIGGSDFRIFHLSYDEELAGVMIEAEIDFWKKVVSRQPPPFDYYAKGAYELQRRIWNKIEQTTYNVDPSTKIEPSGPSVIELMIQHDDATEAAERAKADIDSAKAQLARLAENNTLVGITGTPLGIRRHTTKGYTVKEYDVADRITLEFMPRFIKKRKEILNAFRKDRLTP